MRLRPKYRMELMKQMQEALFTEYSSYINVERYIKLFQETYQNWESNFNIFYKDEEQKTIDVPKTLVNIPDDILIRIAVDLGIPVPTVLPAFPTFTRLLTAEENGMSLAQDMFEKAYKLIDEDPAQSIALANSALESIIKHILEHPKVTIEHNPKDTLHKLTETILREFNYFPSKELQENIRRIGSSLITISSEIETLRSDKTSAHGKGKQDYLIDDELYSVFVLNAITTVGLFMISFFNKNYGAQEEIINDDIPF